MIIALNPTEEVFIVHMSSLDVNMFIHPSQKAKIASSMAGKIIILKEYLDYTNVFSKKPAEKLLK